MSIDRIRHRILSKGFKIAHYLLKTMRSLEKLTIKNFKSIREQTLELGRLNVFIGGNGAGKSNLIEAFRFLREIVNQNLAAYTGTKGGYAALFRAKAFAGDVVPLGIWRGRHLKYV
jgi:hypothetical protein